MKPGESPSLLTRCWTFLRGLRAAARYLAGRMNVVRYLHELWAKTRLPDSVQSILFVCLGNICRSPLAAAYFQSLVEKEGRQLAVRSAGLETTPGKPAHVEAKTVALQHRLSLEEHVTTQVHMDLVDQSDLIVVMEFAQLNRIQRLYPRSKGKVVLLGQFYYVGVLEIADPYGGTSEDFRSCFQKLSQCCDVLAARLGVKSSDRTMSQVLPVNPEKS